MKMQATNAVRTAAILLIASFAAAGASAQTSASVALSGYDSLSATPGTMSAATLPTTANNYYVAPNGSDTAAGTKAAPFKTLARAAKAAVKANTTVFVAPGTYEGGFKTTGNGTAAGRIYWVSTTKWGAKIVPPANSVNKTAWDNRGNYVSIIGFEVDGTRIQKG
ncbi:DUF1565 domain-containing protein, partial [Massilia sp. CFBP 13647]|uniref:DUF1565 domain-containing protein n=1 Tax=Massilia sp. CFBP 13647 TaxID=2775276 RepID=UPI001786FB7E